MEDTMKQEIKKETKDSFESLSEAVKLAERDQYAYERKVVKYMSKNLSPERKWNATRHLIWVNGLATADRCKTHGCTCKLKRYSPERDKFCDFEVMVAGGVVHKIKKEFKAAYPQIDVDSFGVTFLISQIALNMVRLTRAHNYESNGGQVLETVRIGDSYANPISEYIRRLVNQTMKLLRNLGLMPMQLFEKEAWSISKTLEKTVAKMQINPTEVQMQKSVEIMEKKPKE